MSWFGFVTSFAAWSLASEPELANSTAGADAAARLILARIEALVAADAEEAAAVAPEIARWQVSLSAG